MELSHEDVLEILELLEGSDVEYLELDVAGTRLVADRTGGAVGRAGPRPPEGRGPGPARSETAPGEEPADGDASGADSGIGRDLVTVTAPVVGVFYRSPEPGAPPYTETGQEVAEDSTVGLIEVMKMFNSVTAGVRGRVVEILAGNEDFVEYGQPLMTIRPESGR